MMQAGGACSFARFDRPDEWAAHARLIRAVSARRVEARERGIDLIAAGPAWGYAQMHRSFNEERASCMAASAAGACARSR